MNPISIKQLVAHAIQRGWIIPAPPAAPVEYTARGTVRKYRTKALTRAEYSREYRARQYRAGKTVRGTAPQKLSAFVFRHQPEPAAHWPRPNP